MSGGLFLGILTACTVAAGAAAFSFGFLLRPPATGDFTRRDRIPRAQFPGALLGAVVFFWLIPNIRPIFSPDSPFQNMVIPLLAVGYVLAVLFLDHLFARALAGAAILAAHALLALSYQFHVPVVTGFQVTAFLLGITGILLSAKPYWLRDWFRAAGSPKPFWRVLSVVLFGAMAVSSFASLLVLTARGV